MLVILSLPISPSIPLTEFPPVQAVSNSLPAIQNQTQDRSDQPLVNPDDETDRSTSELTELTASNNHNNSTNIESNDNRSDNNRNRSTNSPQSKSNSNGSTSRSSSTATSDSTQQPPSSNSGNTGSGLFPVLSSSFQPIENNQLPADLNFDNTVGPGSSTAGGEIVAISDIGTNTEGANNTDGETLQATDEINDSNNLPIWWWILILAAILGGLWLVVARRGSDE